MNTEHTILLSASQLSIGYKEPLLQDLNLALRSRELVCFMGPNGVGKSSLLRVLLGLHTPLLGLISITSKLQASRAIAAVLTDRIRVSGMTVRDMVSFGRYPYLSWDLALAETDHTLIDKSLKQLNIQHLADRQIQELSDGQFQMTMIAKALAQDTPIIIMDEPTSHLDLNNRVEIMRLLRDLARKENKGILMATHELDLALQMADVIWLAGTDRSVKSGIPEDLVLDGSFDSIFQFKGFDLRTGKVQHPPYRNTSVSLHGEGHYYLWTKNALERNGYDVTPDATLEVTIKNGNDIRWLFNGTEVATIGELLLLLSKAM